MQQLRTGSSAPLLTGAHFLQGSLSQLERGQAYVIDFWATWCPPCRTSLPHLARLQKEYPGVVFAAISTEREAEVVERYLSRNPALKNLRFAYDPQGTVSRNWLDAAGINAIPTTFVIDGSGRITWIGHPMSLSVKGVLGAEAFRGAAAPAPIKPTAQGAMRFIGLPRQWDFAQGNLIVELSPDPLPRRPSVRTLIRVDGRNMIEPTVGSPTLALTRGELSAGRHQLEAIRRDMDTGKEFVTDRAWLLVGNGTALEQPSPLSAIQQNVISLTNRERRRAGLSELRPHASLLKAAQGYAQLMATTGHFDHTGPDGSSPGDRARRAGYSFSSFGENIALGHRTAQAVVTGWMNSAGHRRNILNPEYQEIGVGNSGRYWVQVFGKGR